MKKTNGSLGACSATHEKSGCAAGPTTNTPPVWVPWLLPVLSKRLSLAKRALARLNVQMNGFWVLGLGADLSLAKRALARLNVLMTEKLKTKRCGGGQEERVGGGRGVVREGEQGWWVG